MTRITAVLLLFGALHVASAQPKTSLLEKRVTEELAAEGTVLSRNGWTLTLEPSGDELRVSIAELSTGHVLASRTIDRVPSDREAAVAAITQVAGELSVQLAEASSPPAPAPAPAPAPSHELADLEYERHAIRFGNERHARGLFGAYRGEVAYHLTPDDFYAEVGRPDLADEYHHRRTTAIVAGVVGVAGLGAAIWLLYEGRDVIPAGTWVENPVTPYGGNPNDWPKSGGPMPEDHTGLKAAGAIVGCAGLVAIGVGLWFAGHEQPVSEDEAKDLADAHNQELRHQLGLPVVSRREPHVRHMMIAPYASTGGGGLVLGGQF
jgi:hypothetical protein